MFYQKKSFDLSSFFLILIITLCIFYCKFCFFCGTSICVCFFYVICMDPKMFVPPKLKECRVDNVHNVNALVFKNMV